MASLKTSPGHLPLGSQSIAASGYAAVLLFPLLLYAGMASNVPSLAFAVAMLVLPLVRSVFGYVQPGDCPVWDERIATTLDRLPLVYSAALCGALFGVLRLVEIRGLGSSFHQVGLGLSMWMTLLLSTCVSHDLIHRRNQRFAMVGHCLAGIAGYPVLALEHLAHHAKSGNTHSADWPRQDESAWRFAIRRSRRILRDAYAPGSVFWNGAASRNVAGLRVATACTLLSIAFAHAAAGWRGVLLFLCVAAGVWFGVQVINYIQHWGLGDDRLGAKARDGLAWEDDCRFQAWLTLGISLHQAHHDASGLPYYRIALKHSSPRLPAGYVILMVASMVPRVWFRIMLPVLEYWERSPLEPRSPGRRLTCFSIHGMR
jgi:fatty acid desaturase